MGISIVGLVICRHLTGRPIGEGIEQKFAACVIHDRSFILRPSWVGKPDRLALLICKGLRVTDESFASIKVGKIERPTGHLALEATGIFKTDLLFARRNTHPVKGASFSECAGDPLKKRISLPVRLHEEIASSLPRRVAPHENAPVLESRVGPRVIVLSSEGVFLSRLGSHSAGHHPECAGARVATIPDRGVGAIPGPGLIEIGMGAIGKPVKPGSVYLDDTDRGLPLDHIRVVLQTTKEDQKITSLGP